MNWIKIQDKLPPEDIEVVVWMKYRDSDHFVWNQSWMESKHNKYGYIEPVSGRSWAMGSADGYIITHWMRIKAPK